MITLNPITSSGNTGVTWLNPPPLSVEYLPSQWVCLPNSNCINYILHSYLNGPHNLGWLLYSLSLLLNYSQICFKWQLWYLSWSSCLFVSCTEISVSMERRLIVLPFREHVWLLCHGYRSSFVSEPSGMKSYPPRGWSAVLVLPAVSQSVLERNCVLMFCQVVNMGN